MLTHADHIQTDTDQRWVAAHHQGRALLHRVDPNTGRVNADFALIHRKLINDDDWQRALPPTTHYAT